MKKIPQFKSESQEKDFWEKHDSSNYIDWSQSKPAMFANLKPSSKTISLRLPENLLNQLKILANSYDVPYQSLIKILVAKQLKQEFSTKRGL